MSVVSSHPRPPLRFPGLVQRSRPTIEPSPPRPTRPRAKGRTLDGTGAGITPPDHLTPTERKVLLIVRDLNDVGIFPVKDLVCTTHSRRWNYPVEKSRRRVGKAVDRMINWRYVCGISRPEEPESGLRLTRAGKRACRDLGL